MQVFFGVVLMSLGGDRGNSFGYTVIIRPMAAASETVFLFRVFNSGMIRICFVKGWRKANSDLML